MDIKSFKFSIKKQGFKTFDMILLVALAAFAASLIVALVWVQFDDPAKKKALSGAQSLALQLASGGLGKLQSENVAKSRGPASAEEKTDYRTSMKLFGRHGRIGKDPWNNSYRYEFIEKSETNEMYVVVRSDGPNGIRDTGAGKVILYKEGGQALVNLQGDDLGYAHEIKTLD